VFDPNYPPAPHDTPGAAGRFFFPQNAGIRLEPAPAVM
jgi:hypothetical protein